MSSEILRDDPCHRDPRRLDTVSAVLYLILFYSIGIGLCAAADLCSLF